MMEKSEDWIDIASAPKDGSIIRYRRVMNGEVMFEGLAAWRAVHFEALPAHPLTGEVYAPAEYAMGWMMPDKAKRVPEPTHWQDTN